MTADPTTIPSTSRTAPPAETRGFTGRFLPGLVIGLIVGALAGSFFGTIIGEGGGGAKVVRPKGVAGTSTTPRDIVPDSPPPEPDPAVDVPQATPAPSDAQPIPDGTTPPAPAPVSPATAPK